VNNTDLTPPRLIPYFNRSDYLTKMVNQIKKDFALIGVHLDWNVDITLTLSGIQNGVKTEIENLQRSDPKALYNLLYRIDISEKQLEAIASKAMDMTFEAIIATAICHREMQKVVLRDQFK